jgi:hypothetical protein
MEDIIDIIVNETTNTIEITAQPNDEIIDVNIIDNREDVTLNVTPTVVEININSLTGNFGVEWGDITGTLADQTDLNTALGLKANLVGGKVPASELPSYVDDVVEVANFASLPATGETGKIYITLDNNKIYRWSGSVYVEIADSTAVWGAITGTLSSQTDLQSALDAKQDDLNGTGFVKASGTTISYDNSTYLTTSDAASTYLPLTGGTLSGILRVDSALRIKSGSANGILFETYSTNELRIRVTPASTTFDMNLVFPSATRTYTYPNATGTIALTSDLTAYVPYTGATANVDLGAFTLLAAKGTFSSSGSADTAAITHSSGSGIALNISKAGNGEGIYVNKSSGSGNAVTIVGTLNATTLVRNGGTSSQFLKADGSVDSSTYALDSAVVKLTGNQSIAGLKTFTTGIVADVTTGGTQGFASTNTSASGSSIFLQNNSTSVGNAIGINNTSTADGIAIGNDTSGRAIYISNATASGSGKGISIDNYNGGIGIEVGSDSTADAIKVLHLSGRAFNIQSSGGGYGVIINNTTASTSAPFTIQKQGANRITFTDAGAGTFVSTISAAGATLTGALSGTSATFSSSLIVGSTSILYGNVAIKSNSATSYFGLNVIANGNNNFVALNHTGTAGVIETEFSTGGAHTPLQFVTGGTVRLTLATTGAATFSSSVTAMDVEATNQFITSGGNLRIVNSGGQVGMNWTSASGGDLYFRTASTERLRITSAGNVGIGTTDVVTKFYVQASNPTRGIIATIKNSASSSQTGSQIHFVQDSIADWVIGQPAGTDAFAFWNNRYPSADGSERMRITSGGDLLLGTTTNFAQEAGANLAISVKNSASKWGINMQADAAGAFRAITFYNSAGTSQGYISVNGSGTTTYSTTASDLRLKQNVNNWEENVLGSFSSINPKTFEFIGYKNPVIQKGFIAQDMVGSFPEAYPIDEKGYYSFNPSGMVVYLMKAIKELKAELDTLKNK